MSNETVWNLRSTVCLEALDIGRLVAGSVAGSCSARAKVRMSFGAIAVQ